MSKGKGIVPEQTIPASMMAAKPTQQDFATAYQALCKKMGFQIVGQAGLKPMNDLGGYITVVQLAIAPYVEPTNQNG